MALAALSLPSMAQSPKNWGNDLRSVKIDRVVTTDRTPQSPVKVVAPVTGSTQGSLNKKANYWIIGQTQNDQQSNASCYRHVHVFADGKVSATWTTSADPAPYDSRGAGYNHFNGTAWGAVTSNRIEPERTGFPCYVYNPTTNEEIITSHVVKKGTGNAGGILMNRKTGLGAGTWTSNLVMDTVATIPGVLWAQTAIAGDYMVSIASYTDSSSTQPNRVYLGGVRTPQVYSRYQFSTNTWLVKNQLLPGYDNSRVYAGGGDNYSIDSRGNTIAILMGGTFDDVALWKSTDAGATWSKTIIDSFPVPAYVSKKLLDTTETNDGAFNVVLDNNNMAHCFWGRRLIMDSDTTDDQYSYFPSVNGIVYWKEGTPTIDAQLNVITAMNDENANGTNDLSASWNDVSARYGTLAITTMPNATVGPDGTIYLTYSSLNETDNSTDSKNFRDIYLVYSRDGGETWSSTVQSSVLATGAMNLTSWVEFNTEQVFPSVAKLVNNKLHLTYMQKTSIGRYDATNNPGAVGTHGIYYMSVDTASIFSGSLSGVNEVKNDLFVMGQNYPNPFTGNTSIPVNFTRNTSVKVSVYDLVGKEIYSQEFSNIPAGNNNLDIHMGNVPSGVYVYSIEAEGFKTSRRMLVD